MTIVQVAFLLYFFHRALRPFPAVEPAVLSSSGNHVLSSDRHAGQMSKPKRFCMQVTRILEVF
jgi:hypothetical protein